MVEEGEAGRHPHLGASIDEPPPVGSLEGAAAGLELDESKVQHVGVLAANANQQSIHDARAWRAALRVEEHDVPAGEAVGAGREAEVTVTYSGSGPPTELSGATLEPEDAFAIAAAPAWPRTLVMSEQARLRVRLQAEAPGSCAATLRVQALALLGQALHRRRRG